MLRRALLLTTILTLIGFGCGYMAQPDTVERSDARLRLDGGVLRFAGRLYSGIVETHTKGMLTESTPYVDGRIHGSQRGWYANGRRAFVRPHAHGKKVGAHRGWYASGEPRHLFEFEDDQFHGEYWEWTRSGQIYRYARYERGIEIGAKIWRGDGKIYANYVMTKERVQGLPGGHLCRIVEEGENGETAAIR